MTENLTSRDLANIAARAIDEKKGSDIVIQEVGELLNVTDYFIIATGANRRRVDAIQEYVEECLTKEAGIKPYSIEGLDEMTWVLMDYGNIVVHIFQPAQRDFYRLEQLWEDAPTMDAAAAGIEDAEYSERISKLLEHQKQRMEELAAEGSQEEESESDVEEYDEIIDPEGTGFTREEFDELK